MAVTSLCSSRAATSTTSPYSKSHTGLLQAPHAAGADQQYFSKLTFERGVSFMNSFGYMTGYLLITKYPYTHAQMSYSRSRSNLCVDASYLTLACSACRNCVLAHRCLAKQEATSHREQIETAGEIKRNETATSCITVAVTWQSTLIPR